MIISCTYFLDASALPDAPEDQTYNGITNPFVLVINNAQTGAFLDYENGKRFITVAGFRFVKEYFDLDSAVMLHRLEKTRKDDVLKVSGYDVLDARSLILIHFKVANR